MLQVGELHICSKHKVIFIVRLCEREIWSSSPHSLQSALHTSYCIPTSHTPSHTHREHLRLITTLIAIAGSAYAAAHRTEQVAHIRPITDRQP